MKRFRTALLAVFIAGAFVIPAAADNVSQIIGDNNTVVFIDVPETHWPPMRSATLPPRGSSMECRTVPSSQKAA